VPTPLRDRANRENQADFPAFSDRAPEKIEKPFRL
jgi:hypothetical protein